MVQLLRFPIAVNRAASQDATLSDHASDASGRKRAATEAEQIDVITQFIVGNQKAVGIEDVPFQTFSQHTDRNAINEIPGTNALIIKRNLRHTLSIPLSHAVSQFDHIGRDRSAFLFFIRFVPGSITTQYKSLHAFLLLAVFIFQFIAQFIALSTIQSNRLPTNSNEANLIYCPELVDHVS